MVGEWLTTLGLAALVVLVIYRRARRLFTRQKFGSRRLLVRLAVLGSVCALLLPVLLLSRGAASAIGLALGVSLGMLGLVLTKFEVTEQGVYFTPNLYVGIAVMSLFLGRLAYRVTESSTASGRFAVNAPIFGSGFQRTPMTSAIVAGLLGYYVTYYVAVFTRGRKFRQLD